VRAGVALHRHPLGEERLDGGCQCGHDRCPLCSCAPRLWPGRRTSEQMPSGPRAKFHRTR
jgi:hypothetical protein